jgi:hypothetical protein
MVVLGEKDGAAGACVPLQNRKRQRGAKPKYAYGTQEQAVAMRYAHFPCRLYLDLTFRLCRRE